MRALIVRGILSVLMIAAVTSAATAYVNPPPFEPQRTIAWDFATAGWETPTGGTGWNTGEWEGDTLTHSSSLQWFDTGMWPERQGLIGIDNSNGQTAVTGWMKILVMNSTVSNPLKRLWFEAEFTQWGDVDIQGYFNAPISTTVTRVDGIEALIPGGMRINEEWAIRPNPSWEEFNLEFTIRPGSGFYVDRFEMSTACVPEPSALMALGTGITGLAGFALRRRRA